MKAEKLLKRLSSEGYLFNYIGTPEEDIYAVTPWTVEGEGQGILQICSGSCDLSSRAASVLTLPHAYDITMVHALLQIWLVEDIKHQKRLDSLRSAVSQNHSLYEIARLCCQITDRPVILLSQELQILVQYPVGTLTEKSSVQIINQVQSWRHESRSSGEQETSGDCLIRMIVYDHVCYYLVFLTREQPADPVNNKESLDQICQIFDSSHHPSCGDSMGSIITGLLLRRFELTQHERQRLQKLGWIKREKYYVILFDKPADAFLNDFLVQVQALLSTELYLIGTQYACIYWSDKYLELTEKHMPQLHAYLKQIGCFASISFGFFDLAEAPAYYEQCCLCTHTAHEQGYQSGVWGVSRFQLSVLVHMLPPGNAIYLKQLVHPTVHLLYEIDKTQDTAYLDTLHTYIVSGRSVKRTAAVMNLHVNTVYTRVTKLQDRFNVDFNDDHLLYALHNSINLLNLAYDPNTLSSGFAFLD